MLLKSRLAKMSESVPLLQAAAFYRDIWIPSRDQMQALIRLRDRDRPAFDSGLDDALARGDLGHCVAALEALELSGELTREQAQRLWTGRLSLQQWSDALRLLEDPRFARPRAAGYWHDLACARVGSHSTEAAATAARQATARDPSNTQMAELATALERLEGYEARPGGPADWHAVVADVELLVELHRFGQAAAALSAGMARFGGSTSAKKLNRGLELARTLFRQLDPLPAQSLFLHLRPAFEQRGLLEPYRWACDALGQAEAVDWQAPPDFGDDSLLLACIGQAFAAQGQWKTASVFFGPVATLRKDPFECRLELARCVGRAVIDDIRPVFAPAGGRRKVVDVFRFQDELMLLKLKLEEMSPWVDRFVIIEASATFTGAPKPVTFEQHRHEFAAWADKIVHLVVDFPAWTDSPWAREFYQRDMGLKALSGYCAPDDIVLASDADEIVDRKAVEAFTGQFAGLQMEVFKHFFNLRRLYASQPAYTTAWRAKYLERIGLSTARLSPRFSKWHVLAKGGWHFTSIKDAHGLVTKLRAYSHTEYAGVDPDQLALQLEGIRQGETLPGHERCEIDEHMPQSVRANRERISQFIL